MENQHKLIKGYRDLSKEEVELMNRIKAHGDETAKLLHELRAMRSEDKIDLRGDMLSESYRCLALAKTNLQTGQMWLVRAVALPESF